MQPTVGHVVVNGVVEDRALAECQGLLVREGTYDRSIIGEIERSYGWLDVAGKAVMDIGANIGAFTAWAVRHGARSILAVEPDLHNYELLFCNFRRVCEAEGRWPDYHILRYAVSDHVGTERLWYPVNGKNMGALSTWEFRGRTYLEVGTMDFRCAVVDHGTEVVKCDCEGAEYRFLRGDDMHETVGQVAAEIHLSKREWRDIQGPRLVSSFSGWEAVRAPTIGPKNWTTIAGWRRAPS